jgi:DNA helicase-2/ATP-dependent DNA helicase PcrA
VRHASFGEGRVLATQGSGPTAKVTVHFAVVGPKVVVAKYLTPVE